ncbi:MAG TPA: hypothetical protein VF546_04110 [Pyrinomonadaceae bacterium]|jgi:hypothetical protein
MSQHPPGDICDTLFGDVPVDLWPRGDDAQAEPWASFVAARNSVKANDEAAARRAYESILATPALEARHYLQAYHGLRALGIQPPADAAKRVYGVVVEVALPEGLDIVAAYEDGTARYYNFSGAAVIWERPDTSLDAAVGALLEAGADVARQTGPWEGERPPAPSAGAARISMLTPSGLHFGQAPMDALMRDPMGGPVLHRAQVLMEKLIERAQAERR